jgi:hypothetical protein
MRIRNVFAVTAAIPLAAAFVGFSAPGVANAGCGGAMTPWGGGQFCDSDYWPDGSYNHCVTVMVMGFGAPPSCNRVCPPGPQNPVIPAPYPGPGPGGRC